MYQMGRINSWLDPYSYSSGDGYHLTESLKAIGSGQLLGKGYNHGEVYIPENHTDFIFSVVGEEMGFIGSVVLILIFLFLVFHLIRLASKINSQYNKVFMWLCVTHCLPCITKYWYDCSITSDYWYSFTIY